MFDKSLWSTFCSVGHPQGLYVVLPGAGQGVVRAVVRLFPGGGGEAEMEYPFRGKLTHRDREWQVRSSRDRMKERAYKTASVFRTVGR